jgi:16S rRNA G966 N2-methylase RsmD
MKQSLLLEQVKNNKITADQLTFLLQTDENAKQAYEDSDVASEFLGDLQMWTTQQLVQNYYYEGLKKAFGNNSLPLSTLSKMIVEVDVTMYTHNAYYQTIQWPTIQKGEWSFDWGVYPAYQLFLRGDVQVDDKNAYEEITPLGFSRQPFLYPCLLKQDSIWMSVTPFEIETMNDVVKLATGDVLTLGCGMGYVAFMMSQKQEVQSVTIIEKDAQVLMMFTQFILPQFPHRHKIKLIQDDAFTFLQTQTNLSIFNLVFVDIYQTVEDGLPIYLKLKKIEATSANGQRWHYWLEESMIAMVRRQLLEQNTQTIEAVDIDRASILRRLSKESLESLF